MPPHMMFFLIEEVAWAHHLGAGRATGLKPSAASYWTYCMSNSALRVAVGSLNS